MTETGVAKPRGGGFGDLRTRVISAVVLVAVAVAALVIGGTPFVLFWLAAAVAIHWEWQRMIGAARFRERFFAGAAALAIAAGLCVNLAPDIAVMVLLATSVLVGALAGDARRIWAGAGVLYAGVLIISVCMIRPAHGGPFEGPFDLRAIIWLFGVVWGTDVAAYFAGRLIGGPKVWPAISPGKTWSGTLVGILFGALAGLDPVEGQRRNRAGDLPDQSLAERDQIGVAPHERDGRPGRPTPSACRRPTALPGLPRTGGPVQHRATRKVAAALHQVHVPAGSRCGRTRAG